MSESENKPLAPENEKDSPENQPERASNWITDMYDKMDIPVKALDAMLIILGALIIFLFIFGNKIQLGL